MMIKRHIKILVIGIAIISFLSLTGYVISNATPANNVPIQSVELEKNNHRVIAGIPVPARKPREESNSFFKKLVNLTTNPVPVSATNKQNYKISDRQTRLYKEIFQLQAVGDMKGADAKIANLKSNILMGHILAQRYLHPSSKRADYNDLKLWLDKYYDHPQALRIYKLALSRQPQKPTRLTQPKMQLRIGGNLGAVSKQGRIYITTSMRNDAQNNKVIAFKRDIRNQLKRNQPTMAMNILNTDYTVKHIDNVEYDRLRAQIATVYLYNGKLQQALSLATKSANRSGDKVPLAGWVKGLVQWQREQYGSSANGFEMAARSPYSSGWMVSAAAYWASRANMRKGNIKEVEKWLDLASTYPRTFYGLIATRALGHRTDFNWTAPKLTRDHMKLLSSDVYGARAIALVKANQIALAEAELRNFDYKQSMQHRDALIAFVIDRKLPALSMQLGNAYKDNAGRLYDAALYPEPAWQPLSGYKIDRALIHAIIRQESRFKSGAQNPSGATGLMQLMPLTANYIAGKDIYTKREGMYQLKNPEVNIEIGQKYVHHLLNHHAVGQDLLSLAIAYNAGPGNLSKWKSQRSEIKDPLLFIETIPFHETRAFVERVLANYWIYRMRYNQETPTLDAVAQGDWARYAAQDNASKKLASR